MHKTHQPSIQEQLEAQYPLAKMTAKGGCTVTNPETGLALQKAGPAALPQRGSTTMCASHYRNGNFTKPGFRCTSFLNMTKQNLVTLEKGDKVFPPKLRLKRMKSNFRLDIVRVILDRQRFIPAR